ncbi:MFS transporter [Brevibacillus choshinensis]|uniref:MFS transporter n=1 Tax=Brevibacillus choshinensis TaxID=54911 RepID=UPI002E1B0170|nr:MFS transporter [Brevibacillus choshinensis]MED4753804.1 MFS transporter [Brevibacillus choshinensis]MED4781764.1 MFS transporter [Brevibacillus choshinensis]
MSRGGAFLSRQLDTYPTGGFRVWLLFIAILANFIASYESQIAPVLPLLLNDLHMDLHQYGILSAVCILAAALSSLVFGPLADRHGRVVFLVPSLFLTAVCVYGMAFVDTISQLFALRVVLSFVDGVAFGLTAGLVRDFSPRMGRALAYGFWTFGPVGSNFFAAAIAGWTLPVYGHWQSQFYIAGTVALVSSIVILFTIRDLSPRLRAQIIHSKKTMEQVNEQPVKAEKKVEEGSLMKQVLRVPHLWLSSIGISLFLLTYFTMASFGPKILVDSFGFEAHQAASISKYFWFLNLLTLLVAGWISDRLQLRKVVSLFGAVAFALYMIYFVSLFGTDVSEGAMIVYVSILGGLMGITYGPWNALFSENVEDVKASLQSSAWGLHGAIIRVVPVVMNLVLPSVVASGGWSTWIAIAVAVGVIVYIPLLFMSKGPWLSKKPAEVVAQ